MTSQNLATFNRALVEQIAPHLEALGLTDALLKFTGDGWLLMTEKANDVPALCCLATVMASQFQAEMHDRTGIATEKIPPLRQAICSGWDIPVELPNGSWDWVGDSARMAKRSCECCYDNEVLVDYSVRTPVSRDFEIDEVNVQKRVRELKVKRMEEELPLYRLGELKVEAAVRADAPEHFVYTFAAIGRYDAAEASVEKMVEEGVRPAVVTYNTLIDKAPDYETAKSWLETMRKEGVQPDVVTYNTLIAQAPDYETAKSWLETMREEGVQPDVFTYSTLIAQAPDYETAKSWLETMRKEGVQPDVVTYSSLFHKDLSAEPADAILKWYLAQEPHPVEPIQAAIASYRRARQIDQAIRLALDYPHLLAARKLIREHEGQAVAYFREALDGNPEHPNPSYALGVALLELGRELEAEPYLRKALELAREGPRRTAITECLQQIESGRSPAAAGHESS
jgi:tetratricopeptide (TPR) repeat protein